MRWLILAVVAACGAQTRSSGGDSSVAALLGEPPIPSDLLGREWLVKLHDRFHPRWVEGFLLQAGTLLESSHPLNDPSLEVNVRFAVLPSGALGEIAILRSSGVPEFDRAALEVVAGTSAPPPPAGLRSDDGNVYVEWRFARDGRGDGAAGARIDRRRLEAARAVPLLVAQGLVDQAVERIAAEPPSPMAVGLLQQVAGAVLERALADPSEPGVRVAAAEAIGAARWRPAVSALRKLAQDAPDLALQTAAMRALGALGDRESATLLVAAAALLNGERSAAAAAALAALGDRSAAWRAIEPRLAAKDVRPSALTALAQVGEPDSVPFLLGILADRHASKAERVAAAAGLGAAARGPDDTAVRALREALADPDAAVRAAAARGLGAAAERGVRSRPLFQAVAELLRDRDPRVRAAAVAAAAAIDARAAADDVLRAARAADAGVRAAAAEGLGEVPGPAALASLQRLAAARQVEVRLSALLALSHRPEPEARAAAAERAGDEDPRVRRAAVSALQAGLLREMLATDPAPEVRAAALAALVAGGGAVAALPDALRTFGRAGARERVLMCGAFLRTTSTEGVRSKP